MVEEELFTASGKTNEVKVLGVKVDCAMTDLRIKINGINIAETLLIEEIRIVMEKKIEKKGER